MTAVVVSRKLTLLTGPHEAQNMANEFSLWKQGGIGPGDYFGKSSSFSVPTDIVGVLNKVHLENERVKQRWDNMLDEGIEDPQAFTSDKILVFGRAWDVPRAPFLLVTLLEPGHEQMKDWPMLSELGIYFNSEARSFSQDYPSTTAWITSGF